MGDTDVDVPTGTILYELICCSEWKDEREEQVSSLLPTKHPAGILSYMNPTKYLKKKCLSVPESVKWLKSLGPSWQISITPDGSIVGLLQNSILETRSAKDNFNSTFGRSPIMKDPHPNLRRMAWSRDSSLLAVSFSNGQIIIYDTMASQLCSVRRCALPSQEGVPADVFSAENSLAGLFFASERVKNCTHANELISVDLKGIIKCFRQTNADQMTFHHEASVRRYYPKGIYSAAHIESHGLLLVSGALEVGSSPNSEEPSLKYGITIWRLINDEPYYRIMFNVAHDEFRIDSRRRWKMAVSSLFPNSAKLEDAIFKVIVSPNDKYTAALHTSGTVSIWHLPSLKLYRSWPLKNQYHYWTENTRFNNRWRVAFNRWNEEPIDDWRFHPYDINWWNDSIIIISRVNGCISLCAINEELPTKNLLGDSPELLESPSPVLRRQGKGFFALECELRLKVEERRDSNGDLIKNSEINSLELLDAYDSQFLPKTLIQEVLFWMTDIERFRPPRKRKRKPPVWKETHRLFMLRNITPLELFHQKIEAEEYGEALDLARAYKLDSDLVYQRQWSKAPVSVNTIRDYLGKIKKRNWVLQECLERVPDNVDAARELLQFGLQGTDLSAAVMISQGKDQGRFNLLTPDDLDISQEEYMLLVDPDNLEVKRLLSFRKQFLFYLDMLETYELMIGGFRMVDENFDGTVYGELRRRSPADSAIEMAKASDISALRIMLTHHWFEIAPHYLTVLSSFPETTCPHDYSDFLPEIDEDGGVLLWDEVIPKDRDWCERFLEAGVKLRRASAGSMVTDTSQEQMTVWYEERIREIERFSGITSYALDLAKLGVQRNIPGLQSVLEDLEVVEVLVYDAKVDVTLDTLEDLGALERLQLLMSNATEDTFVRYLRELVFPFLEKCETQEKGMRFHLLDQYLTTLSVQDLAAPLKIFEHSKSGRGDSLISDVSELMRLAYNCIYACQNPKQTDNIMEILKCLPERNRGHLSDSLKDLHHAIDDLELHYQGLQILNKYDIPITLQELKELAVDEEMGHRVLGFFQRICDTARWTKPQFKVNEWKTMLYDLLDLQKKVFKNFPIDQCFELYVVSLLRSGSADVINLTRDFIDRSQPDEGTGIVKEEENKDISIKSLVRRVSSAYSSVFSLYLYLIPYDKSLKMILTAAQHYFDSASNYADPDIELCKVCLNLIHNFKETAVSQMFDLIDAIKLINKDFQVNILPQTVRLTHDKMALVRQAMENIPDGYRKTQQLLKLSLFLQLEDMTFPETESLVFDMAGNAALIAYDMKFCVQICQNIIAKGYHTGWRVFTQVAKYQSDPPVVDHETRLVFINYALNMCPDDEILNVLNSKYLIEIRSLQSRISELSPDCSVLDESLLDVPESDISVQDSLNPVKFQEFLSTTTRWINPLKDMAHVVSTGSGALLKTAKLAALANPLLSDSSRTDYDMSSTCTKLDENELNSNFVQESYPALYLEKEEKESRYFHESQLAFKYNTFSSSANSYSAGNPALELCVTLNRIWHLERSLLGSVECGKRDDTVIEQLVQEILSEDLPWGLAILLSIENMDSLSGILSRIPVTPVSLTVILYFLSISIKKHTGDVNDIFIKDANQVIVQTDEYIQHHFQFGESSTVDKLIELFKKFNDQLTNFKTSRGYLEMELDLLGKSNREKVSRMKNLVNLSFSSEKVDEMDLVQSTGRKDLFARLVTTATTFEEYSCVIEILRSSWIDDLSTSAKKNEWVQLLCAMVRSEEGIVHEEIISVLKQLEEEGKMLDKNCFFYIMGEAKRNKANMLFSRLGFLSKDPKLQIEAAKMVKRSDFEVEDLDEEVLYQLIKRGFIPSFIQKKEFFDGLIQALVNHQHDKSRNWPGIDTVAEQLKNSGHETEAQELLNKHGGSIPGLQVFKSALNLGSWGKWGKGSSGAE